MKWTLKRESVDMARALGDTIQLNATTSLWSRRQTNSKKRGTNGARLIGRFAGVVT